MGINDQMSKQLVVSDQTVFDGAKAAEKVALFDAAGSPIPLKSPSDIAFSSRYRAKNHMIPGPIPSVMSTSPTIGAIATSSAISSGKLWAVTDGMGNVDSFTLANHFSPIYGHNWRQYGNTFPDYLFARANTLTDAVFGGYNSIWGIEFYFYGLAFEMFCKGLVGSTKIWVDGQPVSAGTDFVTSGTGSGTYLPVTFATATVRHIRIESTVMAFGGIVTGPTDSIWPGDRNRQKCVVLGDSFSEGTGATFFTGWPKILGDRMNWNVLPSGLGGTGYLNPGSGGRVKFADRVVNDVINEQPDIVIVAGGINDYGTYTAAAIQAEALSLYKTILTALPNVLLIVVSPFWRNGVETYATNLIATRDALKASATAVGAIFVDVLEIPLRNGVSFSTTMAAQANSGATTVSLTAPVMPQTTIDFGDRQRRVVTAVSGSGPYSHTVAALSSTVASGATVTVVGSSLWTGTGKVGATTGVGNSDVFVSSDATHPTPAGHAAIGASIATQIVSVVNA